MSSKEDYQKISFRTFYKVYYQELASEKLVERWQQIDVLVVIFVAITASTSAITGWTHWSEHSWKFVWVFIASSAFFASVIHGIMDVSRRIKEQEELRQNFCKLRIDLETYQDDLMVGLSTDQTKSRYDEFRNRYSNCMKHTRPDIVFTKRFRKKVQESLDERLKEEGYIDD